MVIPGYSRPEYRAWQSAKQRCFNPKDKGYKNYGGRGITMCPTWRESFVAFYDGLGMRPSPLHSIDRINNDGNYEPGNVRWATMKEQHANKRPSERPMDLTGVRFGRLTALERLPKRPLRMSHWRCRCDCGNETIIGIGHLRSGHTQSCGCLHADILRARPHLRLLGEAK